MLFVELSKRLWHFNISEDLNSEDVLKFYNIRTMSKGQYVSLKAAV